MRPTIALEPGLPPRRPDQVWSCVRRARWRFAGDHFELVSPFVGCAIVHGGRICRAP